MELHNNSTSSKQIIIAIGASVGGIEELHAFFDHTPLAEAAYVIIQHLSPEYKSRMAEILAAHSRLKVQEATHDLLVEPNQVYLIPSQQYMTIHKRRLQLTDKAKTSQPHKTINIFFNSLAKDHGANAIAVILSGGGDDGSEGIVNIKKAGGLVIAQDPSTSRYNNMPLNAIATGVVDYVLAPADMPAAITRYIDQGQRKGIPVDNNPVDERNAHAIINIIRERLPLDFSDYKPTTIFRRIKRRMVGLNIDDADAYHNYLLLHPDEIETLAKSFMISVSAFFRNQAAFEIIEHHVLPDIIAGKKDGDEIKMWVAGCATGEEAYSLAILLNEQLTAAGKDITVKIFATDIDHAALEYAGKGIYPDSISNDVSAERLEKYFTKEDDSYRIKPYIRKMLIYAQHNIVQNPPYCNMDLVSCRNLLIYMSNSLQQKALSMLHFGLRKNGYLFLGSSENAGILHAHLTEVSKKWKIYRNREASRSIRFDIFTPARLPDPRIEVSSQSKKPGSIKKKNNLMDEINSILLEEGGYAGVCVDQNNYVVKSFGKVNEFLLQKIFNFDLMELLPRPMALAFVTASRKAWNNNERVAVAGVAIPEGDTPEKVVTIIVRPLDAKETGTPLLLVLFRKEEASKEALPGTWVFDGQQYLESGIAGLEEDLKVTRERLHDAQEKLDASNENMQSFNEELLSANEEMQSTNEEMQSVNEELQTINTDYQLKIKELMMLNDDMDNYFRSNVNGQLFVDSDLLLKKFSPAAIAHINLRESDIGRPIHNITNNLIGNTLEQDIKTVITTGTVLSREVESVGGNWYQMMIMPYIRQSNNQQDGAIVSFNEITALKKTQADLNRTNQSLKRINEDLDNFVYSASHDLLGPLTSIEGAIKLLSDKLDMDDPDISLFTNMIEASIAKFKENLHELAEVGKIESEILKEAHVLNVGAVLEEVLLSIQDKVAATNARISIKLDESSLTFSKKNLRSILYNLVSNAIKFRSPDRPPEILISTRKENGYLLLQVQDNGIGMQKDKMHNVFNIYKRLHQGIEGQGIGLYLVKKIVDAAGGMAKVESEQGKGSTFSIYFNEPATHQPHI